jgi:bifunctional non-homologous end joining protein LigD
MKEEGSAAEIEGVRITHAARTLFPDGGITKGDVAQYYAAVAEAMLPHLIARPLGLLRCPDGIGACFFQKHLSGRVAKEVRRIPIRETPGVRPYSVIETVAGLIDLVQIGVLEFHPWGSTVDHLEKPDRLIFDLDPDEGLDWNRVVAAAIAMRDLLARFGLRSFVKTTGGKGLHVVVPIKPTLDWEDARAFTQAVVKKLANDAPALYTASLAKTARHGRVFIDYLRNVRGATAVAAYSVRARRGATIATPITWEEVEHVTPPDTFTIRTIPTRLSSLGSDPWKDLAKTRQSISIALRREFEI